MTKCPWPPTHDATPDPAELDLEVGEVHLCTHCSCFYWVKSVNPYVLKRAYAESASAVFALATHGKASIRALFAPIAKRKDIQDALAVKRMIE